MPTSKIRCFLTQLRYSTIVSFKNASRSGSKKSTPCLMCCILVTLPIFYLQIARNIAFTLLSQYDCTRLDFINGDISDGGYDTWRLRYTDGGYATNVKKNVMHQYRHRMKTRNFKKMKHNKLAQLKQFCHATKPCLFSFAKK